MVANSCMTPQGSDWLVSVKSRCMGLEGTDHLLYNFVEEHGGQLRMQQRLELKGHLQETEKFKCSRVKNDK